MWASFEWAKRQALIFLHALSLFTPNIQTPSLVEWMRSLGPFSIDFRILLIIINTIYSRLLLLLLLLLLERDNPAYCPDEIGR